MGSILRDTCIDTMNFRKQVIDNPLLESNWDTGHRNWENSSRDALSCASLRMIVMVIET